MQLSFKNGSSRMTLRTLADLAENSEAEVERLELPADFAHRLMDLGFIPGHLVAAGRSAPGGDPRVFRIDGSEVALRLETAQHIILKSAAS
jgi:ferrous iron transport protein A